MVLVLQINSQLSFGNLEKIIKNSREKRKRKDTMVSGHADGFGHHQNSKFGTTNLFRTCKKALSNLWNALDTLRSRDAFWVYQPSSFRVILKHFKTPFQRKKFWSNCLWLCFEKNPKEFSTIRLHEKWPHISLPRLRSSVSIIQQRYVQCTATQKGLDQPAYAGWAIGESTPSFKKNLPKTIWSFLPPQN